MIVGKSMEFIIFPLCCHAAWQSKFLIGIIGNGSKINCYDIANAFRSQECLRCRILDATDFWQKFLYLEKLEVVYIPFVPAHFQNLIWPQGKYSSHV